MTKSRTQLKITSIIVLIFTVLSLVNIVAGLVFGELPETELPEGSPDNILLITQIFVLVIAAIMLIPQVYVGIKGIKFANKPDFSKAHIVWAMILFVIAILGLISPVTGIISTGNVKDYLGTVLSLMLEIVIYLEYIIYAKAIAKAN